MTQTMEQRIHQKLKDTLIPEFLEIRNVSHEHANHKSSPHTGESHFHLIIKSSALTKLNRVAQQRKIYQILAQELKDGIHALSMDIQA